MKQLIAALIGETGSGKSTFASMCTDEKIHEVISGKNGRKGTTKSVKKMFFLKNVPFNLEEFQKSYEENGEEFTLPLSSSVELEPFDALTILDTQGLNDWKTEEEKNNTNQMVIRACAEADIIFVTIPEGGSVVTTNEILQKIFEQYCHKPIVFLYKAQQSRIKLLKKEKAIPQLKQDVDKNTERYKVIYPKLGKLIEEAPIPELFGVSPLFCVIPNSEELSSDMEEEERQCSNIDLKKCISEVLQYAINLQRLLIDEMGKEYVAAHLPKIQAAVDQMCKIPYLIKYICNITGLPLYRPYVEDYRYEEKPEYSWQGGSAGMYPICGGDYTYTAKDIYYNIKNMIGNLPVSVTEKSALFAVLELVSENRWTPGTFNLPYCSLIKGVPVKWLLETRTQIYKNYPNLFRKATDRDFDNKIPYQLLCQTKPQFQKEHGDWDQCMYKFIYYPAAQQKGIEQKFGEKQWQATVMIFCILGVISDINFCKNIDRDMKKAFWNQIFTKEGKCVLWEENNSGSSL